MLPRYKGLAFHEPTQLTVHGRELLGPGSRQALAARRHRPHLLITSPRTATRRPQPGLRPRPRSALARRALELLSSCSRALRGLYWSFRWRHAGVATLSPPLSPAPVPPLCPSARATSQPALRRERRCIILRRSRAAPCPRSPRGHPNNSGPSFTSRLRCYPISVL